MYREGKLAESKKILMQLRANQDVAIDRNLFIETTIASGEWEALLPFIEDQWNKREKRDVEELLRTAHLAQQIGSSRTKDLIFAAGQLAMENPRLLIQAFTIATDAGLENTPAAAEWLPKIVELSNSDGPLHQVSLREYVDKKPERDRATSEVWEIFRQGEIPVSMAAGILNRSLLDMYLVPGMINQTEADPRLRAIIAAYSGARHPLNLDGTMVSIDAASLITFSTLNLLDSLKEVFKTIVIPHSMLAWLFLEKRKIPFHQPSRVRKAQEFRHLLDTGALKKFEPNFPIDHDLAAEVGQDFAMLLNDANQKNLGVELEPRKFVISTYPVYRVSSLMEETADLSKYQNSICSCTAVFDYLLEKGLLTTNEEQHARSYLKLRERDWPNQPRLSDGASLFLDQSACDLLQEAKLLSKLKGAGISAYLPPNKIEEIKELLNREHYSKEIGDKLESIRKFLAEGIQTGSIKLGPAVPKRKSGESRYFDHQAMSNLPPTNGIDLMISDDRFLNSSSIFEMENHQIPIATTLDVLDLLYSKNAISLEKVYENKTILRRAAYVFVPLTLDELRNYLSKAQILDSRLTETAELKAIRENLLAIKMTSFLQMPKEFPWLKSMGETIVASIMEQWKSNDDLITASAKSDWLMKLFDVKGWTQFFPRNANIDYAEIAYATQLQILMSKSAEIPSRSKEYLGWLEKSQLAPLKNEHPKLYARLIDKVQEFIELVVQSSGQKK